MSEAFSFENPISPAPLPQQAVEATKDSLKRLGFDYDGMLEQYRFSADKYTVDVNMMVFADSHHRSLSEYGSFSVFAPQNGLDNSDVVEYLAYSSVPFHLVHRDNTFSLWASKFNSTNKRTSSIPVKNGISYDRLHEALSEYAEDFNPQKIVNVKQGREQFSYPIFREIQTFQLSLFTLDVTEKLLVQHFEQAVNILRNRKIAEKTINNIATQLLGLVILRDTKALGRGEALLREMMPLSHLAEIAHGRFPEYFDFRFFEKYSEPLEEAYGILNKISYAGFAPDMLTSLYTAAYSEERRRELGRYDTPLYLTRRIWDNIPVESLAPDQRVVADMTCGWGSFLLSGYDRLSRISDNQQDLASLIHGNDVDEFTANLARLALLLYSGRDSWRIDHNSAEKWTWLKQNRPNIIVGNPPFGGNRKTGTAGAKKRIEEANEFLSYAINYVANGGFVVMLMPRSFLGAEASPELRHDLLKSCDLWEIWELPTDIFSDATVRTIVLFAQKKQQIGLSNLPVRIRSLQGKTLERFREASTFSSSSIAPSQEDWNSESRMTKKSKNTHIISYHSVLGKHDWNDIQQNSIPIIQIAHIFPGAIMGKDPKSKRYLDYPNPSNVLWLTGIKNTMPRPFKINYQNAYSVLYPNDLVEPRRDNAEFLASEKVLLASIADPSWGNRTKVAIERNGYYVSDSFWVLVPAPQRDIRWITNEVIAAVVDWVVSNGWIVENQKTTKITRRAINNIPFPKHLTQNDAIKLIAAVRLLENDSFYNNSKTEAYSAIDQILKQAYHLSDKAFRSLKLIEEWDKREIISLDESSHNVLDPNWIVSGKVEEVLPEYNQIKLWIDGIEETQTVDIEPIMPGWLLRPNASFRTKIPRKCIQKQSLDGVVWGHFKPQMYTYLNEDELLDEFAKLFDRYSTGKDYY